MDRRSFIKKTGASLATLAGVAENSFGSPVNLSGSADSLRSKSFTLKVNGKSAFVYYGAGNYSFSNIECTGLLNIEITALRDNFWNDGVEIQPWRHGIRPIRKGQTIRFTVDKPEKFSIARPGDYYAGADILFLFINESEKNVPSVSDEHLRYFSAGIYKEDIHVASNQTVYLAEGAIILGSLNFWDVENAKVFGRGIVIHDGPQNPNEDEGWQHRPNWHGITVHNSRNISVSGITVLVRSRTWMIQLQGSKAMLFDNIKVIGGTKGNANQDGIDWLGCGDTHVKNCFFRCSDDIFAIFGNTGFYDENVAIPGLDVRNILIEGCLLSTSISNVMRVGWKRKDFNSGNVVMRNCDVIHMGMGSCFVPFALAEFWADPGGKGVHQDYLFEDIRLDNWYSLAQLRQPLSPLASVKNIKFRHIWALEKPPLVPSYTSGDVTGLSFENITYGDFKVNSITDLQLQQVAAPAVAHIHAEPELRAAFAYSQGFIVPGIKIKFDAMSSHSKNKITNYVWNFGDGTVATGASVEHSFSDSLGTLLDNSGRFRVLLKVIDDKGNTDSIVRPVVVNQKLIAAQPKELSKKGIRYKFFSNTALSWEQMLKHDPELHGTSEQLFPLSLLPQKNNYGLIIESLLQVPVDGGYTFTAMARDGIQMYINNRLILENNNVEAQVCSTAGNRVQSAVRSVGLQAGLHKILLLLKQGEGHSANAIYWQGPTVALSLIDTSVM